MFKHDTKGVPCEVKHNVKGIPPSFNMIEWPMVAVGLWYGQAYVMDNEHWCILLMVF